MVSKITVFALVFLLGAVLAAPAQEQVQKEDLAASEVADVADGAEKDDLKPAASHWGGHYGGYGGYGGHYGYPSYYGYGGWPSYGYGGYGYGWPYGGYGGYYGGHHGYWW